MIDVSRLDIQTLFMYRYALDKPKDTVNLAQDVRDLTTFPERLNDSYKAEWQSYVKREIHRLQTHQKAQQQKLISSLNSIENGQDATFNELVNIINIAIKMNNSPDVTVMTTPLRTYVHQLLKM